MSIPSITLRFLAEPTDVNFGGKVHGGAVMKWIDQAGFACASQWCGGYAVTVYVGGIHFIQPILIGHLVQLHARVVLTGTTSMHIAVDVMSKRPDQESFTHTTQCLIVFVALDEKGKPRPVPAFTPSGPEEEALQGYAQEMVKIRNTMIPSKPRLH
jgi:acyl-CoA hydrolase